MTQRSCLSCGPDWSIRLPAHRPVFCLPKKCARFLRHCLLDGCGVATRNSLSIGAKVRIRIAHKGSTFTAIGRVIYVRPYREMGIKFTQIEKNDRAILVKWISELRATQKDNNR